jgi:hypothetical protein
MFKAHLQMLDKDGGTQGPLMRSAMWLAYLSPEFIRQGIARRFRTGIVEDAVEGALVRHFAIEQLVGWIDDSNEIASAMVTAYGWQGPLNHNHKDGLGFFRRPTREFPA